MGASLRLGKIFGIPIEINASWILIFALITYLLGNLFGQSQPSWPEAQRWSVALITAVLFFMSVLAHELTHSVVAVRWGIPVRKITLFIFGGVSQLAHEARRPLVEFTVAVVGPLSSVAISGVFAGVWLLVRDTYSALGAVLLILAWVNLSLGVFNMLPGFPLDGGRVLRSAVWGLTGSYWRATQVAARAGQGLGLLMIAGGIILTVYTGGLQNAWMALIGAFLLSAATAGYRQERDRERLKGFTVSQAMVAGFPAFAAPNVLGAPHLVREDTLSEALDRMETEGAGRLPVIQGGMVVGVIGREQIERLARDRSGARSADRSAGWFRRFFWNGE